MGRAEKTMSQVEIPAGNWAAHQLRLVYDDTKELFSSRLSHRRSTKFQSQYKLHFTPRTSRPSTFGGGCNIHRSNHGERDAIKSALGVEKRRENVNKSHGTIKEAICPENKQANDFREWNIPTHLIHDKENRKETQWTGKEIDELSNSLGKVRLQSSSRESVSSNVLPITPIRSCRDSEVAVKTEKKKINNTKWKLPVVSNLANKIEFRSKTQPEMGKFPSVSPKETTSPDAKNPCNRIEKHSSRKDSKICVTSPEAKTTNGDGTNSIRKEAEDAMRAAELHYKIDCVLKRVLFPDIYHSVKKQLIHLPTVEQEMLLKFFKQKAEAITNVRRSDKLQVLLNFLMRGKQFGMDKRALKITHNPFNNLRYIKLLPTNRREKRFELTTWHHQPIYKPITQSIENKTAIFVNAGHMAPN